MELKQLEAYFHVAELGSFTRAAAVLESSQPALSRLIRQLETELRQVLLVRNGRGVTATEAGKVLLQHASGIIQQVQRARHDLDELHGKPGGHFSVGLLPTVARLIGTAIVREFQRTFPTARISIVEGLSTHLSEWLAMGRIDAAVMYDIADTPLLDKRGLLAQELYLISAHDEAKQVLPDLKFSKLGEYRLITPSRSHGVRQALEALAAENGVRLKIELEVDSLGSILDLVHDGIGHSVQPLQPIQSDPAQRRFSIQRIVEPTPVMQMILATSRRHSMSKLAARTLDMVEHHVKRSIKATAATAAAA